MISFFRLIIVGRPGAKQVNASFLLYNVGKKGGVDVSIDLTQALKRMDFRKFSKASNKNYLIEFWNGYASIGECEIEEDRSTLLSCDYYLDYNIKPDIYNKDVVKDFIIKYKIIYRIVDKNNNLFLITEKESIDL